MKRILLLLPSAILLAACSHGGPPATSTQPTSSESTSISDTIVSQGFTYSPTTITVKAGSKVTYTNKDIAGHSVTADDKSFDTGIISQGQTVSFTAPTTAGTYKFHCTAHPSMTGTLIVQ